MLPLWGKWQACTVLQYSNAKELSSQTYMVKLQWNLTNSNTQGTKRKVQLTESSEIRYAFYIYKRPGTSNAGRVSERFTLKA